MVSDSEIANILGILGDVKGSHLVAGLVFVVLFMLTENLTE